MEFALARGLNCPNFADLFRRPASCVHKLVEGTQPAQLSIGPYSPGLQISGVERSVR